MLKLALILVLVSTSVFAQKLSLDARRKQIISIVDEELAESSRLARAQDYKAPDTLLRISELYLEKARLWREAENERFLSIPPEERLRVNKNDYFKQSSQYFVNANDSAELVVKKFPRYKNIGDVYYILAYNHKELGQNAEAQKYFALTSKSATKDSKVSAKSKIALADYYFNDHKYKQAIPLYEEGTNALRNEKWWTKESFNLAWCYYRNKNFEKAISLMKEVHTKSATEKYVDMRHNVERDIGIFFIDGGRMNDAIKFYEAQGINYTEQFVKVANVITTQGRFAQAESLLEQAAKSEKDRARVIQIRMAQLELFDKYSKIPEHLKVSQELVASHKQEPLEAEQFKRLSYQVNKKAAELQKATASDTYARVAKVKNQKSQEAIAYFELSSQLSPNEKAEKTFFQGETAYSAGNYLKSIGLYIKAYDESKTMGDRKIGAQSVEGMLSALAQPSVDKKDAEKYYVPVYTRYLDFDSKSERANSIFVKLFNVQFDSGDIPAAEGTLDNFAKKFPQDYKTQEGMLAKIMDYYRQKKDYSKVKSYVSAINEGKYKVSDKYAEALRSLMTKIQIEGVQTSMEKGQKGEALKGYHQIYSNAESTPKAKVNAAYNLSALYYELGEPQQSYQWGVAAIKDMEVEDVTKFADSYLAISSGLFLRQKFAQSADLSHRVLGRLCKQNSSNKIVAYKNAVFISLANNDLDKAIEVRNLGRGCSIPDNVITEVSIELLKDMSKAKRWETYETILAELEKNSKNYPQIIRPYEDLRKEFINLGEAGQARAIEDKQQRFFNEARQQKLDIPVDALDLMADKMLVGVVAKKSKIDQVELRFPEAEFNTAVKFKLKMLDQLTSDVNIIQKLGSGKGIVEAYRFVIEAYEDFGISLKAFTPPDKSPEYVTSFKKAMSDVYNPILGNAKKQRNEVRKLISDNKILTKSNFNVLYTPEDNFKRYLTIKEAVLMDRGGKR